MTVQPRIQDVIRATAQHFGVRQADIRASGRRLAIVRPRQIGMTVAHAVTMRSLPEIGRAFGNFDHSTVIHAIRRTQAAAGSDEAVRADIEAVTRIVEDNYLDWLTEPPKAFQPLVATAAAPAEPPKSPLAAAAQKVMQAQKAFDQERFGSGERRALDQLLASVNALGDALKVGGADA